MDTNFGGRCCVESSGHRRAEDVPVGAWTNATNHLKRLNSAGVGRWDGSHGDPPKILRRRDRRIAQCNSAVSPTIRSAQPEDGRGHAYVADERASGAFACTGLACVATCRRGRVRIAS
jgi:hypothetical protein